jgi:cell wall-associated NlpC family hydrolase
MTWTGSGRKTAALCAAVVLLGTLASPAHAAPPASLPVPAVLVPAAPEIPSPDEIAAAKASESATAAQVASIDRLLADASAAQDASLAASLQANNAYGEALVELQIRRDAAAVAAARASAAGEEQEKTRRQIGQLAGDLYRSGGLNPALSTFVTGTGNALQQAATLEAVTAGRTRAFHSAETAAVAAESLTAAAADANRAADDAARKAEDRKLDAERASDAQRQAVSEARSQRTVLVDQLANLKNTTVALESERVDALDRQRRQDRLAAVTAAGQGQASGSGSDSGPGSGDSSPVSPRPQAPAAPPAPVPPAPSTPAIPVPAPASPAPALPAPVLPAPAPVPPPAPVPTPPPAPGGSNQTAISVALGKVGPPYFYQYGGTGARGFDCSGLVQNAFAAAGKYLPRTASQQFAQAPVHVPLSQAQPGDLLVWGSAPGFYHVAIYLGAGRVVQALNEDAGITVTDLASMSGMQLHPVAARY